jgi:hypothetical protein
MNSWVMGGTALFIGLIILQTVRVVRRDIALQALMLEEQGLIRRGVVEATTPESVALPAGLENWQHTIERLSAAQIREGLQALAAARAAGVLEAAIPAASTELVWQGVRLITDRVDSALIRDILEVHT